MTPESLRTVDEVLFFLTAFKKAQSVGTSNDFDKRLTVLFAEGQMSEISYKFLREICGFAKREVKTVIEYQSNGRC